LSILCLVIGASAQNENRWSLGISFSPDLCYRSLTNSSGDDTYQIILQDRNSSEFHKIGMTGGLNIKYSLSKKISFESGILYSNKGYSSQGKFLFGDQIDPVTGVRSLGVITYHYKYVDIPFKVNFVLTDLEKIHFYLTGGLVGNIFLKGKMEYYYTDRDGTKHTEAILDYQSRKFNISPFIGIGIQLRKHKRTSIQIEPLYRRQLFSTHNAPIHEYLWNFGVNAVVYYKL